MPLIEEKQMKRNENVKGMLFGIKKMDLKISKLVLVILNL